MASDFEFSSLKYAVDTRSSLNRVELGTANRYSCEHRECRRAARHEITGNEVDAKGRTSSATGVERDVRGVIGQAYIVQHFLISSSMHFQTTVDSAY